MRRIAGEVRSGKRVLTALGVVLFVVSATVASAAAAPVVSASQSPQHVIVVLRNQHTNLRMSRGRTSPRISAYRRDQAPVLARAKSLGARNVRAFSVVNGLAATVTPAQRAQLAADPSVAEVVPDLPISESPVTGADSPAGSAFPPADSTPRSGAICPSDPAKPLLEPEALGLTNTAFSDSGTPQAQNIVDGTGVKVAFLADGVDINNPDFIRADGSHVFVDYQDFTGEGPNALSGGGEAFGDASAIAAQGLHSYDLSRFVSPAHPLPPGCTITVRGMAPGASLYGLKVFGNANTAPTSRFIQAIDYAVTTDGVDVLNESFGANPYPDNGDDPITLADRAAVAAGVTVVVSTGDAGPNGTIGSPASAGDGIISVGATTQFQSYEQTGASGAQLSNGTFLSDNISALSSGGVTQAGGVPDLVAPGDLGWALCTANTNLYSECTDEQGAPSPIQDFGGTSQSAPLTAGAAALVIEAYEQTHGGVRPTPELVKQLLTSTATDLGSPSSEQGSGLLNSLAAVQAAQSWADANGNPGSPQGNALVVDKTQLQESGDPGASVAPILTVTNVSATPQTVQASTRSFENVVSSVNGTAALNTATAPFYVDANGGERSYVSKTFLVGASVDRLEVSAAANTPNSPGRIVLIDPSGAYAAYSLPQGQGNFAHVDVRFPAAGTWTAYFAVAQGSGFNGTFAYSVVQTDFTTHGTVTPASLPLAPGQSGTFTVDTQLPASPGDLSASVQLTSSAGVTTSVPLTLRADIPPTDTQFSGTITGGNGRAAGGPAQSNVYSLEVPAGKKDLSIGMTFTDPNQETFAYLTAPDGQVYSFRSNVSPDQTQLLGAIQIYRRDPQAGQWTLTLEVTNPVSGLETAQGFSVHVAYDTVDIQGVMPDSTQTDLAPGVAVTVPVTVKNTGVAPAVFFADGRLDTIGTIPLAELSGNSGNIPLPTPPGVSPVWIVPSEVGELDASATATLPANLDFVFESGEPDVYSAAVGNQASVQVTGAQVSPGPWFANLGETGPFNGPAPAGTASVSASARGQLFDPAISSSTGDFWQVGVDPAANAAAATRARSSARALFEGSTQDTAPADSPAQTGPLTLNPGETGTIMVTIAPSGPIGSVVSGNLYVDSVDQFTDDADELVDLPYSYTIQNHTATTLAASTNAAVVGQPVTYTATVTPDSGAVVPTGTVSFIDGSTVLCQASPLSATAPYTATCEQTYQATGSHAVVATYNGSADTATSTSDPSTVQVGKATTAATLTSAPAAPLFGQPVTYTVAVDPVAPSTAGPAPSGTVSFSVDGRQVGPAVAVTGTGTATSQPVTGLAPGAHQVSTVYSGDAAYLGVQASATTTVGCAQTITGKVAAQTIKTSVCVDGGTISGTVTVVKGGALSLLNATISGPVSATGATAILACATKISGPVTVSGSTGPVQLGGTGCATDTISGPVTLTGGTGALTVDTAKISGPLQVGTNTGGVSIDANTVNGPVTVSNNSGTPMAVSANTVGGPLSCSANTPAPSDAGLPNRVSGPASGQCAKLN